MSEFILASRQHDSAAADEAVRQLGSAVARRLGERLSEAALWNRYHWIDDIAVYTTREITDSVYEVRGAAIWGDDRRHQWVEPFEAHLRWDEAAKDLAGYAFRFADAATGLGRAPYSAKAVYRAAVQPVAHWLFEFREPAA